MIRESSLETYTSPWVKQVNSGNLLYDAGSSTLGLCGNLEGWGGVGWGGGREETSVYLRLICVVVWQKPTQHCKTIILQLKIK